MVLGGLISGLAGGTTVAVILKAVDDFSKQTKNFQKELKTTEQSSKQLAKSSKANMALIAGATLTASVAFSKFAFDAANSASKYQAVLAGTQKLTSGFAESLRTDLKSAVNGTVSDFNLLTQANQAMMLGISQNQLPDLFKSAAVIAQAQGRDINSALTDITTGIGRQSAVMLDNLGIIVSVEEANQKYADSLGILTSELTKTQEKMAFQELSTERVIAASERLGGVLRETTQTETERLTAEIQDLEKSIGEDLQPAVANFLRGVSISLGLVKSGFEGLKSVITSVGQSVTPSGIDTSGQEKISLIPPDELRKQLQEEDEKLRAARTIEVEKEARENLIESIGGTVKEMADQFKIQGDLEEQLAKGSIEFEDFVLKTMESEEAVKNLKESLEEFGPTVVDAARQVDAARDALLGVASAKAREARGIADVGRKGKRSQEGDPDKIDLAFESLGKGIRQGTEGTVNLGARTVTNVTVQIDGVNRTVSRTTNNNASVNA